MQICHYIGQMQPKVWSRGLVSRHAGNHDVVRALTYQQPLDTGERPWRRSTTTASESGSTAAAAPSWFGVITSLKHRRAATSGSAGSI